MNVEIGTEAVQFPEEEYINAIFVAVYRRDTYSSFSLMNLSRMGWILALYFSQKELETVMEDEKLRFREMFIVA